MSDDIWKGIFAIVVTPFTESYELDEASLRKQISFCIEAGATGLVGPANAGEFATMSDDERKRWLEIVISEAAGAVPVVTTTAGHAVPAAALRRYAESIGADGIMAMPPPILKPNAQGCYDYYVALAQAVNIPIVVQNFAGEAGTPMPTQIVANLCRNFDNIQYVKEERVPEPRYMTDTMTATGDACKGVFGGQGGIYLLEEFRRGAIGNMPATLVADILVNIWNQLVAGDEAGARKLYNRILPLLVFERLHGVAVYKETLHRRGIFATKASRYPGKFLDEMDLQEFDAIYADIEPLFQI